MVKKVSDYLNARNPKDCNLSDQLKTAKSYDAPAKIIISSNVLPKDALKQNQKKSSNGLLTL
ncbi:hypothetical protein H8356DRAFT_1335976 [Neocallimastix lanati (nom. inval.)]|nr:hypothetical protein H8356DRAFT_1335976 [Neocallimastix sp. JGI-2020a]